MLTQLLPRILVAFVVVLLVLSLVVTSIPGPGLP
jgi:hypothetical protein